MRLQLKQHAGDMSKTALASVAATACDGALFWALMAWTPPEARLPGLFAGLAAALGGVVHFSLCRGWVYERFERALWRSALAYVPMSGGAALAQAAAVGALHRAGLAAGLCWALAKVLIYLLWTYPMSRFVVFGAAHVRGEGATPRS